MPNQTYDLIILGAGPAGLMAAGRAAALGRRVLVLEKALRPAGKLLLAGGGKGNVTNRSVSLTDYVGEDSLFAAEALRRFTPDMFLRGLARAGVAIEEREEGRIFCAHSAKDVLNMLLKALPAEHCRVLCGRRVLEIQVTGGRFLIQTEGEGGAMSHAAPRLIVATGSPAWPQCGADDSGLRLLHGLGHKIIPARPILAPLVLPPGAPLLGLAGISAMARVSCDVPGAPQFVEPILFTHKGLSGPAILQISCYWRKESALSLDFLPQHNLRELLDKATGGATPQSLLHNFLPDRLVNALLPAGLAKRRVAELSRKERNLIIDAVCAHKVTPLRSEGMGRAEAAAGGVDTREVDAASMESRLVAGLFLCGEVLDVTGRLGGYNLHWAWASGSLAGESAAGLTGP